MNLHRRRAAGLLFLLLASCSGNSSDGDHHDPDGQEDISDVIYVGGVTDEALVRLLALTPKNDPKQALQVTAPDLGSPVPADAAPTFVFQLAAQAMGTPAPRAPSEWPLRSRPSLWQRSARELWRFLSPEGTAHAHGAPFNGTAYYLVISDAKAKPRLQVFTSELSFTPEAVDWQNLGQAPQPLTLTITSAVFDQNDVPRDGGPFVGGAFEFSIE